MQTKDFDTLYGELVEKVNELRKFYDIDKIKPYSVYVWSKDDENSENLFDIQPLEIEFYKKHKIIEEAEPIVEEIQNKLLEVYKVLIIPNREEI